MTKPIVFISYSHKDETWKDKLVSHLGVLQHENLLDIWDDRRIGAGDDWFQKIQEAVDCASIAILLISADFLTSKFILGEEVPRLLERREKQGLLIYPVIVKPCLWQHVQWLAQMQARPKDGRPISGGNEYQIDSDVVGIADEITSIIRCAPKVPGPKGLTPISPEKISHTKFPSTNLDFFPTKKPHLASFKQIYQFAKSEMLKSNWDAENFSNKWVSKFADKEFEVFKEAYLFAKSEMFKSNWDAENFSNKWVSEFADKEFEVFKEAYLFAKSEMFKSNWDAEKFSNKWVSEFADKEFEVFKEAYLFAKSEMFKSNWDAEKFSNKWVSEFADKEFEVFKEAYLFAKSEMFKSNWDAEKFAFERLIKK